MPAKILKFIYLALIIVVVLLMNPNYSYFDSDTFWHLEVGRYMIEHREVLHHAIHTFYEDKLPYLPHEFGFQVGVTLLYLAFGWPGIYLLTGVSLFFLIMGMLQLGTLSRKELGYEEEHPLLLPFVLLMTFWIYLNYFKGRPQMVSSCMIVWFFVYLRKFQLHTRRKDAAVMLVLSLAIANVHAGVWLVIAVFTGMAALEAIIDNKLDFRRVFVFTLVYLVGPLNPGGVHSLLYIQTVTHKGFNNLIIEWQPNQFNRADNLPILLLLLFFAAILPFVLQGRPFRYFLMLGILYLGVSNFKENLFMWLFIPYFAAVWFETVPLLRKRIYLLPTHTIAVLIVLGILLNTAYIFMVPPVPKAELYPVQEMDYILKHTVGGIRPKVLAEYGVSGYVMFRGGNVLCDGRQDPFITQESMGVLNWTAFERSMYGFSEYLPNIVSFDQPDYLIVQANGSQKLYEIWVKAFGEPQFKGSYGSVFTF